MNKQGRQTYNLPVKQKTRFIQSQSLKNPYIGLQTFVPASCYNLTTNNMKVEIWSDVMCPFCYIGKRRFEKAMAQFPDRHKVEVVWKSFQLNPDMKTDPSKSINQYLSESKGWTTEQARQVNAQVTKMAEAEGLHYDFDRAIVANSFDAHRLIQLAKTKGKGDEMEERLFKAYFTEGKNTADHQTLAELGVDVGLNPEDVQNMLSGKSYTEEVEKDIYESRQIGVRGVPYFVFNDRYVVTGAQPSEMFLGALTTAWGELEREKEAIATAEAEGPICKPGEECD